MRDLKKISLLTTKIAIIFVLEKIKGHIIFGNFRDTTKQIAKPMKKANHSAINVAHATPSTPQPKPKTNQKSRAAFKPFIASCNINTYLVFSSAINHPIIA